MAERRMFTKKITDSDIFTELPPTTQCLYFHLCMSADDDGFSNHIRSSMFNAHATTSDIETLINKRFIIPFESGVIVIKHWRMHNYIQSDRHHSTLFKKELEELTLVNGEYDRMDTTCIQDVSKMDTEVRLGKDSKGKVRLEEKGVTNVTQKKNFVRPTVEEVRAYCEERRNNVNPETFIDFYESKGWMVGKNHMKDWKAAVRTWERQDRERAAPKKSIDEVMAKWEEGDGLFA